MAILNKKLALAKSRKTIVVDKSDNTEVVIKPIPMDKLLPLFTGDGSLGELASVDKVSRDKAINEVVKSGKFKFEMIRDVVLMAVAEPPLHDGPTDDEKLVNVDDISRYHMIIFQEALEFSGLGGSAEARAFRPDGSSAEGNSRGGSVQGETERSAGTPEGQPRLATTI